ncbi:MAG TPA: hypothetical protein VJZ00_12110 [Thermoanaerobaculia bacterium]|nr:hypothetical protein [Thermoanaerobaculia bacterium]
MTRSALLLSLFLALAASAQDSPLFPRFSVTAGTSSGSFSTNARIDPDTGGGQGTLVSFERDLGLEDAQTLPRLGVQWRPFARHELAATWFKASRDGLENIDRDITFRDEVYPVQALVTTAFDLDYASATYTYWLRRSERDGFGLSLGAARIALDASVTADRPGDSVTVTQQANTDVPVALIGVQGRVAFTPRIHGEANIATLPRVKISDYTGTALIGQARVELRPWRWLGIGAAYDYFRMDVDVAQVAGLHGSLDMTIRGPQAYIRLAY